MMNEKIAILVDSGTDVPREVIDNGPFFMVPLRIILVIENTAMGLISVLILFFH